MDKLIKIEALKGFREQLRHLEDPQKPRIRICMTGCRAYGAIEVRNAIAQEVSRRRLENEVEIRETGCHGFCARAPVLAIDPKGWIYQQVRPEDAREIIEASILKGRLIDRLLYGDPQTGEGFATTEQIPFYRRQKRRILSLCGLVDPRRIEHYLIHDGYEALAKVLRSMSPETVIEEVEKAGLRGRGGWIPNGEEMAPHETI